MHEVMNNDDELLEKRIELRQKLKSKLLTLSPSRHVVDSFNKFIPNARDLDFLEHHGLDCVMNYLIETKSLDFTEQLPHVCSSCRMDATENWWYSTAKDRYLCDQCERNRVRHLILEQHRQSMKSAFLQAKESERRLEVDYHQQQKTPS
jgi:hypothetical protein